MESYEENRVKGLIDKSGGLFLTRRRRSLHRTGGVTGIVQKVFIPQLIMRR